MMICNMLNNINLQLQRNQHEGSLRFIRSNLPNRLNISVLKVWASPITIKLRIIKPL